MTTPLITTDWTATGLVPLSGCEFWHQYENGVSQDDLAVDYSGNGRDLTALSVAPALTMNVLNGQPGWYFTGSSKPLIYTKITDNTIPLKHLFIVASFDEATFTVYRGLFTDSGPFSVLVGNSSGTKFFDYNSDFTSEYRKNDTVYAHANQQAPVGGAFALIEVQIPAGITLDSIQVGQQTSFAGRKHKGYFIEQIGYSRILDPIARRQVQMHFNLRYRVNRYGVPLYFPSVDIVPALASQTLVNSRFNDIPLDWEVITEFFEYEDHGKDFNEVADDVPRFWEYQYQNVPKAQKVIFDQFNDTARRANTFYFKDKENTVWSNVRIDKYDRAHEKHMRWRNDVPFTLVGYNSTGVYEAPEIPVTPEVVTFLGGITTFLSDDVIF